MQMGLCWELQEFKVKLQLIFAKVMSVPIAKNFNTIDRFKAVDTRTNNLQDSVRTFPVGSQISSIWLSSVLEDFTQHKVYFVERSWTNL